MDVSAAQPSRRTTLVLWLILGLLAALAWVVTALQARSMGAMAGDTGAMAAAPAFWLFLAVWLAMMVAMMFPAVAPVVALFAANSRGHRAAGRPAAPAWVFLAGYLAVWGLFGVAAYLLALAIPALSMTAPGLRVHSPVAAGLVLLFAGLYQWSPLKGVCLRHCRSPLGALLHHWRDGRLGAVRMGFGHGAYCLGCCWGLMLVLFVVGLMNLAAMAGLAALIFAEKVVPRGPLIGRLAGVGLAIFGLAVLVTALLGGAGGAGGM